MAEDRGPYGAEELTADFVERERCEEAEIRDIARRASLFRREIVRQGVPGQDFVAMMLGWFQLEADRLREERRDRE